MELGSLGKNVPIKQGYDEEETARRDGAWYAGRPYYSMFNDEVRGHTCARHLRRAWVT